MEFFDCAVELVEIFEIEASKPVLDEGNVSAVRGSLAAGNGRTSISSSESIRGQVPNTTTANESD